LRDIIQTMYTGCLYLLIDGDKISGEVAPNKGLKQGCPLLSPLLYSLYTITLTYSWPCREVLPLPWIPSLWLCWWHCSHFEHSWMSTVPAKQISQLHTFQGAQAQHWQNKNHGLLQQRYFCNSHLYVRWHTSRTCHSFQIPWIHSHSWWKYAYSSWEDGRQFEARDS